MTMTFVHWRTILFAFTAIVTGVPTIWMALRPTRQASRHGMRGLKRQRALMNPMWSTLDPLVRWTSRRVGGLLDEKTRKKVDQTLTYAGDFMGLTAEEYVALIVLSSVVGGLLGLGVVQVDARFKFVIPVLMLVLGGVPHIIVDNARVERFRSINRGLPYAIDLMALSMSAGLDFPGAVGQVVAKSKANESLRDELAYMLQQFHVGRTRAQVLKEFSERAPIEAVREFVHALLQAEERGTPVVHVLEVQATTARTRRSHLAESAASDMKAKMAIPTMMIVGVSLVMVALPSSMLMDKVIGGMK